MRRILEDIKNRSFRRVYLLFGDEPYMVRELRKKLVSSVAGEDTMNTLVLEGPESFDLTKCRDFTDAMPFLADYRTVVLAHCGLFKSAEPEVTDWVSNLSDTAVVIMTEDTVDKRTKLYKTVVDKGLAAELNILSGKEREDFILREIGRAKCKITRSAFELLNEKLPESMDAIIGEIKKLTDYAGEEKSIDEEAVRAVVTERPEDRIFDMVDAAVSGNRSKAFDLYYDLVRLEEAPLKILSIVGQQLSNMSTVKDMLSEQASYREISEKAGIRDFLVKKLAARSNVFAPGQLEEKLREVLDLEYAVKSGNLQDSAAVELMLFSLTK